MTPRHYYDLISAIKQGQAADVDELLRKGANANVLGLALRPGEGRISALAIAIERADVAMVDLLLAHGANLHDIDHVYSAPAPIGATTSALHFLCGVQMQAFDWCAIAATLLSHGVHIDAHTRAGLTALELCTDNGLEECRNFLVASGADALAGNPQATEPGMPAPATPLHRLACSGQWKNGLLKLLKGGADIDTLDPDGNSPLDLAVAYAVRMRAERSQRIASAHLAIHGWISAGARPSTTLLDAHPEHTTIGDALRMYRIDAAVACGDQGFVWHVLENTHDKQDADCQAAGARLDLGTDHPDVAETLDLWLASGFGDDVSAPAPLDLPSAPGPDARTGDL